MKTNSFIAAFLLICFNLHAQWTQTSCPAGGAVQCMVTSGSGVFAGTQTGGIYLSADHGATWNAVNNGLTNTNVLSLATDGTNIFAGTSGGGVFLSSNNGTSWTGVNNGLTSNIVFSLAICGSSIFAGTSNSGGIFLSTNNGGSWTPVNTGLSGVFVVWSFAVNGSAVYASTDGGGVYETTSNGSNWNLINAGLPFQDVKALAIKDTTLFAAVTNGGVYRSTDNGSTWTVANTGVSNLYPLSFLIIDSAICVGTINNAFISHNNGNSWSFLTTNHLDIWSMTSDSTTAFLGCWNDGVWTESLTQIPSDVNETINNEIQTSVFPNPFHQSALLKFDNPEMENYTLTFYDAKGQLIRKTKNITGGEINLERGNLPAGLYFFSLQSEKNILTGKFVIE